MSTLAKTSKISIISNIMNNEQQKEQNNGENNFMELMENRALFISLSVIAGLILLVLILHFTGIYRLNNLAFWNNGASPMMMENNEEMMENEEDSYGTIGMEGKEENIPAVEYMKVRIPLLLSDDNENLVDGKTVACDKVVFIERYVEKNPAILNASLGELFAFDREVDFWPGNFVGKQENLSFDRATIENGVAKIYVNGEVSIGGVCDEPRLTTQVTETAMQFSTVNSVEIYLNGELYQQ